MRCRFCDVSDVGLSDYRADGKSHSKTFHQINSLDFVCSECYESGEEVMQEFYELDLEEEELEDAFDYDD